MNEHGRCDTRKATLTLYLKYAGRCGPTCEFGSWRPCMHMCIEGGAVLSWGWVGEVFTRCGDCLCMICRFRILKISCRLICPVHGAIRHSLEMVEWGWRSFVDHWYCVSWLLGIDSWNVGCLRVCRNTNGREGRPNVALYTLGWQNKRQADRLIAWSNSKRGSQITCTAWQSRRLISQYNLVH